MIGLSVLIPQYALGELVAAQLPELSRALAALPGPVELLVVDDHSPAATLRPLRGLLSQHEHLRVLRLDRRSGISAAITAGIAAARGDRLITLSPAALAPAAHGRGQLLSQLLDVLVRADLVVGRPRRSGFAKLAHRLTRIPRWLLLGLEVRDPECLVWAARREALAGLELPRGMYRYLSTYVAMRGYRVCELTIEPIAAVKDGGDGPPNPGDLLAAWWLSRRWQRFQVRELGRRETHAPELAPPAPHTTHAAGTLCEHLEATDPLA